MRNTGENRINLAHLSAVTPPLCCINQHNCRIWRSNGHKKKPRTRRAERIVLGAYGDSSDRLVNVLNFNFKAAERFGQTVVNRGENHEEDETENASKYRPQKVNESNDSELVVAEDDHRNADQSVDEAHQHIKGGHYLAGLENGYADQLLFHSLWLVNGVDFICGLMN